ncbi:MAG: DAK2 domain-containing protein [Clostridia bacterium]
MTNVINAALLKNMIISAANTLNENKGYVDSLNVFPVPDGDTGTNMALTFMAAAREISSKEFSSVSDLASAVAKATLRGARGNSGVILSQIFRGISLGLAGKETVTTHDFAVAIQKGSDTAYGAVMKPTEGTILTVVRFMAKGGNEFEGDSFEKMFAYVNKKGKSALDKTPEMLPQLKQAGVVDAGGRGLLYIFEGMAVALNGETFTLNEAVSSSAPAPSSAQEAIDPDEITFGYCTEFIIEKYKDAKNADEMRRKISPIGDCLLIIEEDDIVKVHIHTNNPGFVLEQAVKLGQLINIKIENMRQQHSALIEQSSQPAEKAPMSELAVISVSAGEGIAEVFSELGVSYVIRGGQTMNPSTDDILSAIEEVNAKNVIILPNNKNIILASEQAKELADVNVKVIPTKTIPQGITAMISFLPESDIDTNVEAMNEAITMVKSGSITHAVRDTSIDDKEIHEGDYLGMYEGKIAIVNSDLNETFNALMDTMVDDTSELITVYYGEDVSEEDAQALSEALEEKHPDCDVSVRSGGQPVYYYFIAVE